MDRLIEIALGIAVAFIFLIIVVNFMLSTSTGQPGGLIAGLLQVINVGFGFGGK